ncbi:hypothetical protein ACT4RX_10440, partial [Ornithobacterium rhinotracheale]
MASHSPLFPLGARTPVPACREKITIFALRRTTSLGLWCLIKNYSDMITSEMKDQILNEMV